MIQVENSDVTLKLLDVARRQKFIRITYITAKDRNYEAAQGFRLLGTNASSAVPALQAIYNPTKLWTPKTQS